MHRLLVLTLAILTSTGVSASEPIFPAGSRIGLVPPSDMKPARGLSGFRNMETGAGILLVEMPAEAYPGLAATFTDQGLKAQGFTLKTRDKVAIGSTQAILVTGQQADGQRKVPKTVLLASDPGMTALVIGQLPEGAPPEAVASIERALKTVSFRPPLTLDEQIASLPFGVSDKAGFRIVRTMAGNSILLTEGPSDAVREASQPVVIVAQSFAPPPPPPQREAFARQGLASSNFIKDTILERSQSFRQGGAEWHEIVAKAKDTASGTPVIVMQTIRFEPDGYIRTVGVVRPEERDSVLPRFRRLVDSLTEK